MTPDDEVKITLGKNYAAHPVGQELLLLKIRRSPWERQAALLLNRTATLIYGMLAKGMTPKDVATKLSSSFRVSQKRALRDANRLFRQLINLGVLKHSGDGKDERQ